MSQPPLLHSLPKSAVIGRAQTKLSSRVVVHRPPAALSPAALSGAGARGLTPGQFALYDRDGDGLLNAAELRAFLESAGESALPQGYILGLITQFDHSQSGGLAVGDMGALMEFLFAGRR